MQDSTNTEDLVYRLTKRAEIRRQISTRKSVQEGAPDRIANLLEEAAEEIVKLRKLYIHYQDTWSEVCNENQHLINQLTKYESPNS